MKDILRRVLVVREAGVLAALILIMLFFGFYTTTFFTATNLTNVLRQSAVLGVMTMAVTFLIISGEFDLSIGSTFALSAVMSAVMMEHGIPMIFAFLLALVLSGVVGFLNGVIVTKLKIPSFIATLGTMMIIRSAVLMASERRPRVLADRGLVSQIFGGGSLFGVIPVPIVWLLAVVAISWIVLAKTPFGYKVYATGGNIQAARLSGINTDRVKITNFVLTSFAAGLAGLISFCFLRMVAPVQGEGYELEAIAATVIGGTALGGGVGSIFGAFIGSFMLAIIKNGLVLIGTNPYLQDGVLGLVILVAVVVNLRLGAARSGNKPLAFLKGLRKRPSTSTSGNAPDGPPDGGRSSPP
jgi:ribose/xylose/arabinose/galactoside ABC-type transport system permease subunit